VTGQPFDYFWLGKLSIDSLPFVEFIRDPNSNTAVGAFAKAAAIGGAMGLMVLLTVFGKWRVFWHEWLTSLDAKKIGIMYIVLAMVMLLRAVIEAGFMRAQQMLAVEQPGPLAPEHFGELFSTHGTIMIFFVAMPFVAGLINYVMPLQIGARDMSFPVMNQISLGLTVVGAVLVMISLVLGQFSTGGWTAYPPYTGKVFSPGVGPDYWIWSVAIAGIGSTLTGINFAVTIYKERAPGMHLFRMPLFTWTALCAAIILIFAIPPLTVSTLMLALDRYLGFHFFTNDLGGNLMNYANLFWLFGHPEVYLLVLPAFGVFSEVFATYSGKRLYGYVSLVYATIAIAVLSFTVWLHHFFTMGQGANVNIAFGVATMVIAIPTGVKVYDWMATMFRGRIRFSVPMVYATGFLILFVIGGLTGVILANPTIDYQVHNSVFLVAHFHNVLIPGVLYGMLAGYHYWFPKAFGFRLSEGWGYVTATLWIFGFTCTFFPLYFAGLLGMPRRSVSFSDPSLEPFMLVAVFGALIILLALGALVVQLFVSIRNRQALAVPLGDPWNGRTLEWATSSPPPEYNFAIIPTVTSRDMFALDKARGTAFEAPPNYKDITLPKNTAIGMIVCIGGTGLGLALVWQVWWLALVCIMGMLIALIGDTFRTDAHRVIPAADIAHEHQQWLKKIAAATPVGRLQEATPHNQGFAAREDTQ